MGLTLLAARAGKKSRVIFFLLVTFLLGASFLFMELSEFTRLALAGNSWQASGFLSAYFTLVGTHGLHIFVGLLWIIALVVSIILRGLTRGNMRKLVLFSLFWHFLDIIWIFIFTLVYLFGII
jgi:cytochrome o ubiquinol oxidase subunit 3